MRIKLNIPTRIFAAIFVFLSLFTYQNCQKDEKKSDALIGDLLLYRYLNPSFTFSCDFIVPSGICYNLNTNAAPYNCSGQGGTVSSVPCPCNGAVVGSCRTGSSTKIYYNNVFTSGTAQTQCASLSGVFSLNCLSPL